MDQPSVGFDPVAFVNSQPGWFKNYEFFTGKRRIKAGSLSLKSRTDYSISPRLLLALIEFQTGALSQAQPPDPEVDYPLGYRNYNSKGIYRQLLWAANLLNEGYYRWREGLLKEFDLLDGRQQRLDPWINATTASLQYYFSRIYTPEIYNQAIQSEGLALTYKKSIRRSVGECRAPYPGQFAPAGAALSIFLPGTPGPTPAARIPVGEVASPFRGGFCPTHGDGRVFCDQRICYRPG